MLVEFFQVSWDLNKPPKGATGDLLREASIGSVGSSSGQNKDSSALVTRLTRQVCVSVLLLLCVCMYVQI